VIFRIPNPLDPIGAPKGLLNPKADSTDPLCGFKTLDWEFLGAP